MMRKTLILAMVTTLMVLSGGCTAIKRHAYEGIGRDTWQQPEQVIQTLKIQKNDDIADIGAGGGYFTFRLADTTGPGGTVYAVDVDRGMNEYLKGRAQEEGYKNIIAILARYDDPRLAENGVDLIFICNTYHHMKDRVDYFARVRHSLRPGGRVAIIDFAGKTWLQRLIGHITPAEEIQSEMEAAGYHLEAEYDFLPSQNFLVFYKEK